VSNSLFGITVPQITPVSVWPYDPDFGFQATRKWETTKQKFSPVLEQRFIRDSAPLVTFSLGFANMAGTFFETGPGKEFHDIWAFWNTHKGRAVPFYFYDPRPWGTADHTPTNYRDSPTNRLTSPGTGANPAPTTGRYIVTTDEDNLSIDQFAMKIRKAQLHFSGYPG
jgi:hypothetical protein